MTYQLPDIELSAIKAIAREWVDIDATLPQKNACILAARVASQALNDIGIDHELVPIASVVENEAMRAVHMTGLMNDDAWNVCCGKFINFKQDHEEGSWQGHIVIFTDNYFVDLTAPQFSRPAKNIIIDRPLIIPISDLQNYKIPFYEKTTTWTKWIGFPLPSGRGRYLMQPQLDNLAYMHGRDWKTGHLRFNITDNVKKRLEAVQNMKVLFDLH